MIEQNVIIDGVVVIGCDFARNDNSERVVWWLGVKIRKCYELNYYNLQINKLKYKQKHRQMAWIDIHSCIGN